MAGHYQALSRQTLCGRLSSLTEESKQKRAEFQQRAMERRKQFEADWGERGRNAANCWKASRKSAASGQAGMRQAFQPGGEIEKQIPRPKIEACC